MSANTCRNNPTARSDQTTANALRLNIWAPKTAKEAETEAIETKINEYQ